MEKYIRENKMDENQLVSFNIYIFFFLKRWLRADRLWLLFFTTLVICILRF